MSEALKLERNRDVAELQAEVARCAPRYRQSEPGRQSICCRVNDGENLSAPPGEPHELTAGPPMLSAQLSDEVAARTASAA